MGRKDKSKKEAKKPKKDSKKPVVTEFISPSVNTEVIKKKKRGSE